jgi:hypothetical protein
MKNTTYIECEHCGGEAELERDVRPDSVSDWRLVEHGCDADCVNHPDTNPTALFKLAEEDDVRRSEKNFERTLSGDHGLSLREQSEQARRLK